MSLIYNLLNAEDEIVSAYLEVYNFPEQESDTVGEAKYVDQSGNTYEFTFTFDGKNVVFNAVLRSDGQTFEMKPILNADDEIVRFSVVFETDSPNQPEIIFAWENESDIICDPTEEIESDFPFLEA